MKKIVIAPRRTFNSLSDYYRKDDPFIDIKFLTKEDVIKESLYQYDNNTLFYIVKKLGYDFSLAKLIAKDLIYPLKGGTPRLNELIELKKELLDCGLLKKNEYFEYELDNASIDIHFYSEKDQELAYFLQKSIEKGSVKFFSYAPRKDFDVIAFNTYEDELFYMMNEIANLIKNGTNPNDIYVYGLNNEYSLVFERLRKNFGLYFNNYNPHLLSELPLVDELLNNYSPDSYLDSLINEINPKNDDEIKFKDILGTYRDKNLDYINQRRTYIDILNNSYRTKVRFKDGVNVIDEPFSISGTHLFILNFATGKFPRVKKDDGYLSDAEKVSIGLPSLENINFGLSELYLEYLSSEATLHVSYSLNNGDQHLNPSYFIGTLKLNVSHSSHQDILFSKEEARILLGKESDIKKNYRLETNKYQELSSEANVNYNIYDNRYKPFDFYTFNQQLKLSYSQISTYVKCSFMYFLNYILKVDEYETAFVAERGNIGHNVLERINENTKREDFDKMYEEEIAKSDYQFSEREKYILELMRPYFKRSFEFVLSFEKNVYNPVFYREKKIIVDLTDKVALQGRLDKVVLSGDKNQYVSVIDYKTGKEDFQENRMEYGFSLQLPIYTVLLKHSKEFKDKETLGLFIEPLVNPDVKTVHINQDKYDDGIVLRGVYLNDLDKLTTLVTNVHEKKVIYSLGFNNDGVTLKKSKRAKEAEWFTEKYQLALKRINETAESILNNDFAINPKLFGKTNESCKYCKYRDICFKREKDEVLLAKEDSSNGVE